jgi:glucokinase
MLAARTGLPVGFGHDVRAGALAEATVGAARGERDVLFVPVGAGVAGAALVGGRPLVAGGYAGEIGHLQVDPAGEPCPCGGRGCVETVASGLALARRYAARTGTPVAGAAALAAGSPAPPPTRTAYAVVPAVVRRCCCASAT